MQVKIDNEKHRLDQWDTGQRLLLEDIPAGTHVDFVHKGAESLGREAYEEGGQVYVDIPDTVLQTAGDMNVWFYVRDGERGETVWRWPRTVWSRPKPADYIFTDEEKKTWEELQNQIDELKENGGGGGASGEDGGYYTPSVSQPTDDTMRVDFTPSSEDMPVVEGITVTLPAGAGSGAASATYNPETGELII